jgi:hypothetical protein
MSIRVMTAVWEYSSHKGAALLLMLAIADHAGDDGTNAYPSVRRLAQRTRLSERTVQRTIQECEASGELVVNRPDVREHRPNYYTIRLDRLSMGDTTDTHVRLAPMPKRPAMGGPITTRTVHIEPSEDSGTEEEAERLWLATLDKLRGRFPRSRMADLEDTRGLRMDGGTLIVAGPARLNELAAYIRYDVGQAVRFEG